MLHRIVFAAAPITERVPDPASAPDAARRDSMQRALAYMDLRPGMPLTDIAIDRVFIGSCTNSRIEDLRAAAKVLDGRRAVIPATAVPGSDARYCQPATHYLLSGLVQCGVCGSGCSSFRRWQKVVRPSGAVSVYHHAAYRCNRRERRAICSRWTISMV